jgi:hypothetical protein
MIERAASASTTELEVPRSANVLMGVLLILTSSGDPEAPKCLSTLRKLVLSGGDRRLPDRSTVADRGERVAIRLIPGLKEFELGKNRLEAERHEHD